MILQDIKETKRYGHTDGRSFGRSDNVKTVYPPTNKVCGGYNNLFQIGMAIFLSVIKIKGVNLWVLTKGDITITDTCVPNMRYQI